MNAQSFNWIFLVIHCFSFGLSIFSKDHYSIVFMLIPFFFGILMAICAQMRNKISLNKRYDVQWEAANKKKIHANTKNAMEKREQNIESIRSRFLKCGIYGLLSFILFSTVNFLAPIDAHIPHFNLIAPIMSLCMLILIACSFIFFILKNQSIQSMQDRYNKAIEAYNKKSKDNSKDLISTEKTEYYLTMAFFFMFLALGISHAIIWLMYPSLQNNPSEISLIFRAIFLLFIPVFQYLQYRQYLSIHNFYDRILSLPRDITISVYGDRMPQENVEMICLNQDENKKTISSSFINRQVVNNQGTKNEKSSIMDQKT